jgi:phosphatidylglycerophosphate synthase
MALQQSDTPPPLSSQLNWPNKITLVRIFLVPLLLVFLISPAGWYPLIAATIFLVAAFTDWLDGHVARSTNQITRLGQLLDPIADKLLVTAALVSLVGRQQVPAWMVVIIICRELAITGLRFIIATLLLMPNLPILEVPGLIVLSIGTALSVISGIDYLRKYLVKVL